MAVLSDQEFDQTVIQTPPTMIIAIGGKAALADRTKPADRNDHERHRSFDHRR